MTLTGRSKAARVRKTRKAVLVYQAGIANVFAVESFNMADYGREAVRLFQSSFGNCESFALGLDAAGVLVTTAHCNQAGDIAHSLWSTDLAAAPFCESFAPVFSKGVENTDNR